MSYFLFEVFGIEFELNLSLVITFITGILFGVTLTFLIYLYSVLISLRKTRYIIDNANKNIKDQEILNLIENYKQEYKRRIKTEELKDDALVSCIKELVYQIASWHHPKSKKPVAELTIDELLLLSKYITERIEEIFSKKLIRIFRKMKLSTILSFVETTNSKPVKEVKKHNVPEKIKTVSSTLNLFNPFHWMKKAVVDTSISMITNKICLLVIQLSGEEAYKVFSRKVLIDENETYKKLLEEVQEDIKRENKEAKVLEKQKRKTERQVNKSKKSTKKVAS